ncbi:MAG: alpha/beta fold hydrolase [Deltaproteobacteria bacterium]|nr:MAG: alpha/beta fold hydrolase [Deltaproteobacteria bacterium]
MPSIERRQILWILAGVTALGLPVALLCFGSLPALFPTSLRALDADWEPYADRSQRRLPDTACGLTELRATHGAPCEPARPSVVERAEVTFPTPPTFPPSELKGTLHLPQGLPGPRPAVVLLHGSGPQDRHGRAPGELVRAYDQPLAVLDALAADLARRGLVVLQYDKRSCVTCYPQLRKVNFSQFSFEYFLEDAHAAVDYLAGRPEVDGRAIVVVGHSQGATFGLHVAEADDRVLAAAMLAGFSGTFRDTVIGQLEGLAAQRMRQGDLIQGAAIKAQAATMALCMDRINTVHDPDDRCMGGGVTLAALYEYEVLNRRTLHLVGSLDKPLFFLSGTLDLNVPPAELARFRQAAQGRDAEFHLISGIGHGLTDLHHPPSPPEIDPRVLDALGAFLGSVSAPEPPELPVE